MYFHLDLLRIELESRIEKNPRYSLRAFAKALEMHPSALSRVLAAKKSLSKKAAIRIAEKLKLDNEQRRRFYQSVIARWREEDEKELGCLIGARDLHNPSTEIQMDEARGVFEVKLRGDQPHATMCKAMIVNLLQNLSDFMEREAEPKEEYLLQIHFNSL